MEVVVGLAAGAAAGALNTLILRAGVRRGDRGGRRAGVGGVLAAYAGRLGVDAVAFFVAWRLAGERGLLATAAAVVAAAVGGGVLEYKRWTRGVRGR